MDYRLLVAANAHVHSGCWLAAPADIGWTMVLQVWSLIDQKVGPWVRRVPILQTALSYAQRWFLSVGRS